MVYALPTVLQPAVVQERVSRIKVVNNTLQTLLGLQPGGPRERTNPIRRGAYDIFNDTRDVADARRPGTAAGTIDRNPVGSVNYTIPHHFDRLDIPMELVNNIRPIGGPAGQIDTLGQQYLRDQEAVMKQRLSNIREFQVAAMLRGSYTYTKDGERLIHTFSGGSHTIDFQHPSGNRSQLNMLDLDGNSINGGDIISATWATAGTPILTHIEKVNASMVAQTGRGLCNIVVNSVGWGNIRANTQVQNAAGSVNTYFDLLDRDKDRNTFTAKLKGAPWITFHINDNVLKVNGTQTKLIPDTAAVFLPDLADADDIFQYDICPSPVVEYDGAPQKNIAGDYYWYTTKSNPAKYELFTKFDGLPTPKNPYGWCYGTVVF